MNKIKDFTLIGIAFAAYIILSNLVSVLAVSTAMRLIPPAMADINFNILLSVIGQYIVSLPVFIAIMRMIPKENIKSLKMKPTDFVIIFLILYPISLTGNLIGLFVNSVISKLFNIPVVNAVELLLSKANIGLLFLFVGLIGPIIEELITRRLLIDRTVKYGEGVAILLSASIFALIHGNFFQIFYAFGLGLCFAYVYVKTGRLRYSTIMHIIFNSLSVMASMLLRGSGLMSIADNASQEEVTAFIEKMTPENMTFLFLILLYVLMYIGFIVAGTILLFKKLKNVRVNGGELSEMTASKKLILILSNPGMLIFLAVVIYTIVDNIVSMARLG